MASGLSFFSFSSPPHPTSNPWSRTSTTTNTYFTPQIPSKSNWSGGFAPTSPSPLRTSRNANLMSSPTRGGNAFQKYMQAREHEDENTVELKEEVATPFSSQQHSDLSWSSGNNFTTPFSTTASTSSATTRIFSFDGAATPQDLLSEQLPSLGAQDRATQFQFSARARSSSPSALLQSHTKDNRDSRKRLFLDRLKTRRDDARIDRAGDQVLRMDFMRERRMWEAEKERVGNGVVVDVDVDVGDDEMDFGDAEGGEFSPTDDKEVEELAKEFYALQAQQQQRDGMGGTGQSMNNEFEEFSDDGYDEAFMEVLSQDTTTHQHEPIVHKNAVDFEMDMS